MAFQKNKGLIQPHKKYSLDGRGEEDERIGDKKERLVPDMEAIKVELNQYIMQGVNLTKEEICLIKDSWNFIVDSCENYEVDSLLVSSEDLQMRLKTVEQGVAQIHDNFYKCFSDGNEKGRHLFAYIGGKNQNKLLSKIYTVMIRALDDFEVFRSSLESLGVQHHIFDVSQEDYHFFASCFSQSVITCVKEIYVRDMIRETHDLEKIEKAWLKYCWNIGEIMFVAQKYAKLDSKVFIGQRKIDNGFWKNCRIVVQCDYLYICKGFSYFNKGCVRLGIPIHMICDLQYRNEKSEEESHVISMTYNLEGKVALSFETFEFAKGFLYELELRVNAYWICAVRTQNVQTHQQLQRLGSKNGITGFMSRS